MHAIDIKIPTAPIIVYHNEMDHVDLTDIEFCGGYVFVAMDNLFMKEKGRVVVFHSFSSSQPMAVRYNITGELYFFPSTRHIPCYFSLENKNSPSNKTRSEITCSEPPARHWCRFTNSR